MRVRFGLPDRSPALSALSKGARTSAGAMPMRVHALPVPAAAVVFP